MITMIMHREARQDGDAEPPGGGEDGKLVLRHRGLEGRVPLRPVRDQLIEGAGLEAGPGQDVTPNSRRLSKESPVLIALTNQSSGY